MNQIDRFLADAFPTKLAQLAAVSVLVTAGMGLSFLAAVIAPYSKWAIPAHLSMLVAGLL